MDLDDPSGPFGVTLLSKPQSTMEGQVAGQTAQLSLTALPRLQEKDPRDSLMNGKTRASGHFLRTPGATQEIGSYSGHSDSISVAWGSSWPVRHSISVARGAQARLPLDGLVLSDPGLSLKGQGHGGGGGRTAGLR